MTTSRIMNHLTNHLTNRLTNRLPHRLTNRLAVVSFAMLSSSALVATSGCSKTVAVELALVEPCDQTNGALNGASSFSVATSVQNKDGTSSDDVITFNKDQGAQPVNVTLGNVIVTVKAFAEDITAGGGASAVPQAVGRSMPLLIEEISADRTALLTIGKLESFGKTTNAAGECTAMTKDAPVPGRHGHTATFVAGLNQVLIVGGAVINQEGTETFLDSAELWDPTTGEFEEIDLGPPARAFHAATALPDGRVLITGGLGVVSGQVVSLQNAEIFDPATKEFSATFFLKQQRAHHTATLMVGAGIVAIVGGCAGNGTADLCTPTQAGNGNNGVSTDLITPVETFDVATGVATVAIPADLTLLTGRAFHQATSLENGPQTLLVVSGGANASGAVCDVELFRATGGELARVDGGPITTSFPANKCPARHAAVSVIDPATNQPKALFIGGQTVATEGRPQGLGTVDVFEFTTTSGVIPFAPLLNARAGHNAATLADNSVLIVGGSTGTGSIAEMLRPQPGTGVIAASVLQGGPSQGRENAALALLPSNQVFWSGGMTIVAPVQTVATTELFFGP